MVRRSQRRPSANKVEDRSTYTCRKCICGTCFCTSVLLLILLVVISLVVPMAFKYSIGIQQNLIFPTYVISDKDYSNIEQFNISGVRNFYIDIVNDNNKASTSNITLGVWQILPEEMLSDLIGNNEYNFDGALMNRNYSILLYIHGNGADRTDGVPLYRILRKYFHVFAVDYRGYGDSSKGEMHEECIVNDLVHVYQWIRTRSKSHNMFIWGHSLGTGIGTQLVSKLKSQKMGTPTGLVLETPFTSVTDVMKLHPIVKLYSFLPWCKTTILDPIVENGMDFDSKKYIPDVDCPIMILHAKDDSVIAHEISSELYNIATNERNMTYQGNVTYHLYEALGYDHMNIFMAPELPEQIRIFKEECIKFEDEKSQ